MPAQLLTSERVVVDKRGRTFRIHNPMDWCDEDLIKSEFHSRYEIVQRNYKTPCWEWSRSRKPQGYGSMHIGSKNVSAHRVAWFVKHSERPPGNLCVCHKCDNPPCVNPDHLFLGTYQDNSTDSSKKGRQARLRGMLNGHAKLSDNDVRFIRRNYGALSYRQLADKFGVTKQAIYLIVKGRNWRHFA